MNVIDCVKRKPEDTVVSPDVRDKRLISWTAERSFGPSLPAERKLLSDLRATKRKGIGWRAPRSQMKKWDTWRRWIRFMVDRSQIALPSLNKSISMRWLVNSAAQFTYIQSHKVHHEISHTIRTHYPIVVKSFVVSCEILRDIIRKHFIIIEKYFHIFVKTCLFKLNMLVN